MPSQQPGKAWFLFAVVVLAISLALCTAYNETLYGIRISQVGDTLYVTPMTPGVKIVVEPLRGER